MADAPLQPGSFPQAPPPPPQQPASSSPPSDDEDSDAAAEEATERLMQSVERAFAAAKKKGVAAAQRLMKEMQRVCASDAGMEISLPGDDLLLWQVSLFDFVFDESSLLHRDLRELSEAADDLVPLVLRIRFPEDFPFAPPLVYIASPTLHSEYVFDGALCMEMLVDWQPTYGNVEALLTQVAAFLAQSARVASCVRASRSDDGSSSSSAPGEATEEKAKKAYASLKAFHAQKGWGQARN